MIPVAFCLAVGAAVCVISLTMPSGSFLMASFGRLGVGLDRYALMLYWHNRLQMRADLLMCAAVFLIPGATLATQLLFRARRNQVRGFPLDGP